MELAPSMRAAVVGLGRSGVSALRYLHRLGLEVRVSEFRQYDELGRAELELVEECGALLETGGHSLEFLRDLDLVVVSPGVPWNLEVLQNLRRNGVPVFGELALAADRLRVPVIAVTGSNGKTTVTGLIGHLLQTAGKKVFVGGNIGTPLLDYLADPGDMEVLVLELSSFQLQASGAFRPDIGLLLNLSPDHLDWHGSMEKYTAAKLRIFANQGKDDLAILGGDDDQVMASAKSWNARVLTFGRSSGCRARVVEHGVMLEPGLAGEGEAEKYDLGATPLDSLVNRYNAAAAILAARSFGVPSAAVEQGLADFELPEHRMTLVAEINGVRFVNDSKATNVGAVVAALAGFSGNVVLIAGGRDKGSNFSVLRKAVQDQVRHLILLGEAADSLARALGDVTRVERAAVMEEAVSRAFAAARPGDTVLLAPACASFDMFDNYGQRGRVFSRCVRQLKQEVEEMAG